MIKKLRENGKRLESWSGLTVEAWQVYGREYFRFHIGSGSTKTCCTYDKAKKFATEFAAKNEE